MMPARDCSRVRATRLTYLTLLTPWYPGTMRRRGPPCARGKGSPFISQASNASSRALMGTERSTITVNGSTPSGNFSPPVPVR